MASQMKDKMKAKDAKIELKRLLAEKAQIDEEKKKIDERRESESSDISQYSDDSEESSKDNETKTLKRKAEVHEASNSSNSNPKISKLIKNDKKDSSNYLFSCELKVLSKRIEILERKMNEEPSNYLSNIQSTKEKYTLNTKSAFNALKDTWIPTLMDKLEKMHIDINKQNLPSRDGAKLVYIV